MIFLGEPIIILNFILCTLISILTMIIHHKNKNNLLLNISYAFGLFSLSHILNIMQLAELFKIPLITVRLTAYMILIIGIFRSYKQITPKVASKMKTMVRVLVIMFIIIGTYIISLKFGFENTFLIKYSKYINILSSLTVVVLSIISKNKNKTIFKFLSIGFFLFFISHTLNLFIVNQNINTILLIIRMIAYFVIFAGIYLNIKNETIDTILKYTSSIKLQLSIVGIMIVLLLSVFYLESQKYSSSDPSPKISALEINKEQSNIKIVKTGLFIKNFPKFDIIKNEFILNAILWFEFDPYLISLDTIKNFSFNKAKILKQSKVKTKIIDDKLWAYYKIKLSFSSNLNYKFFPLEDHKIYITLINSSMNPKSEILVSYNTDLILKDKIYTGDWKSVGKEVEYGYIKYNLDRYSKDKSTEYPIVSFELSFKKAGIRKTLVIFLPLYLVFFLSIFSLLIGFQEKQILTLSVGSTSALIFNLISIENMSPDVRYFTIANKIYILLLISAFFILLFNIYIIKKSNNMDDKKIPKSLILFRSYIFLFFVLTTILATYSIVN